MKNRHSDIVVEVDKLGISYKTRNGLVQAVREVSFSIAKGETLGLVGESGCGKSTTAYGLIRYLGKNGRVTSGEIRFQGTSLIGRTEEELRTLRGNRIAMVYQDPMSSLNPAMSIADQMTEVLTVHRNIDHNEARQRCVEMLRRVYMPDPENVMERYPHQISGGQQQRVVIGMAMLNDPALLIMDEPTTALDVTVEAAVLDLVADLRNDYDTAILFITHNLGVIARISDRIGVMYAGELVELASANEIFSSPKHPYTQGLIRCLPKLGRTKSESVLVPIPGRVPSPTALPRGCLFSPRCDYTVDACNKDSPIQLEIKPEHWVRCIRAQEIDPRQWEAHSNHSSEHGTDTDTAIAKDPIIEADQVTTYYEHRSNSLLSLFGMGRKQYVQAVDDVSFNIKQGNTLGIVGESGCGKSTLIKTLIGLEGITDGKANFLGFDISKTLRHRDISLIKELQMVFQNPDSTLNPSYSIGKQIGRPLRRFKIVPREQSRAEVIRLLKAVKLDSHYYDRLPRQLSGGEKQRVGIARAFAGRPDLVLCDEPVSALDVSVQAAVLNLLLEIQEEHQTTMIFIAHDLSVVRFFSDYVAVMYLGKIVEYGKADDIYAPPYHPYTESLLASVPIPDPRVEQKPIRLEGNVPSPLDPPTGCRFHTRCPRRALLPDNGALCETDIPPWRHKHSDHRISCHIPLEHLSQLQNVFRAAD